MAAREILRLGLIGVGKHGSRYARHLREDFTDLQLVAVARRDAAQAAAAEQEFGAAAHTDYRELIGRGDLDAVIVVVPPVLHPDIIACAVRARLPVLLEKPAAPSLALGRQMLAALRADPVPVMVAQTLRWNAVVRALMAEQRARPIGPIHSLAFTQRFEPSPLGWLDDPARSGGGMTLHTGVHMFDLLHLLTGLEPDSVSCQMVSTNTRKTEDNFAATVRLGGGAALATISSARTTRGRAGHVELAGEEGALIGDHVLHYAYRVVGTAREPIDVGAPAPTIRDVLRDFAAALRSGAPMPVTLEDGLRAVAVADACYAAARSGRVAEVERLAE